MNLSFQKRERIDFEELGYQTMLQCGDDEEHARNICGLRIHAHADQLVPKLKSLQAEIEQNRNHGAALHSQLYDRPVPVNDAAMFTHSVKARILFTLTALAALACLAGNMTTFYLFGFGLFFTLILGSGTTALPLVVGYLAYERIVEKHKNVQVVIVATAVVLCFAGIYELAQARRIMVDKAAATAATASTSYVDGAQPDTSTAGDPKSDGTETQVRQTLGDAMRLIMIAADLMLGFLFGLLVKIHTDEDYAAWRELREITKLVNKLEETVSELQSSIEIVKKNCAAGILRAQITLRKRRIPYHRALTAFVFCALLGTSISRAQTIERYEGIMIDTSGSISRSGTTNDLFQQYLISTKKLLATEPEKSRVWVSNIAVDSFGGNGTLVKGWTPEARGIFTADLNRARRELAHAFEQKSSGLSPVAAGTDIFGALWRFKALFESGPKSDAGRSSKTIFIFSDMMNETPNFLMPTLLARGPEQMLELAKTNGLVVPMKGYKIYVYGATPSGLSPQAWLAVKNFWAMYFQAAGAELVTYSAECDVQRS